MTRSQWNTLLFWVGAILVVVLATVFYRPAAAKTGSLLVWMNNLIYVMDIDTLVLERVGPAHPGDVMVPSPGCFGQADAPCWVTANENLYPVAAGVGGRAGPAQTLPLGESGRWPDKAAASWSPDGLTLAYSVFNQSANQAELRLYNPATGHTRTLARGVDPAIAPAWTAACQAGPDAPDCELAYKTGPVNVGSDDVPVELVAVNLSTGRQQSWPLSAEPIFELRWTPEGRLLYSRPKRHFRYANDNTPAYPIPTASQLANMSPNSHYTVYYQPFTLADCQAQTQDGCMHLGVWLVTDGTAPEERRLIYSQSLAERTGGLNFVPSWAPNGQGFIFFQDGNLIYYSLEQQQAAIWYKGVRGKLRSIPVFSPNEEAVAFVDNQGQGYSEYRLVVINPRLQPVEHIIDTKSGFRVLAWLPN